MNKHLLRGVICIVLAVANLHFFPNPVNITVCVVAAAAAMWYLAAWSVGE